jgi:hypothetical protein
MDWPWTDSAVANRAMQANVIFLLIILFIIAERDFRSLLIFH